MPTGIGIKEGKAEGCSPSGSCSSCQSQQRAGRPPSLRTPGLHFGTIAHSVSTSPMFLFTWETVPRPAPQSTLQRRCCRTTHVCAGLRWRHSSSQQQSQFERTTKRSISFWKRRTRSCWQLIATQYTSSSCRIFAEYLAIAATAHIVAAFFSLLASWVAKPESEPESQCT